MDKTILIRSIHGKTYKRTVENMPEKPRIGQQFTPDGIDNIATITAITKGKHGPNVEYHFEDNPDTQHSRPYAEVKKMGWAA